MVPTVDVGRKVPQKITAFTQVEVRVKTGGKSSRPSLVTDWEGKPQALKCQISECLRAARPMFMGRQIDPDSNIRAR